MKIYKPKKGDTGYIHCASDHGPYFCDTTGMRDNYFSSNSHYEQNINNPNITLNFDNLELLCQTCHAKLHNSKYSPTRDDVCFDEFGDLIKNEQYKISPKRKKETP